MIPDELKQVAARIQDLRDIAGMSAESLAAQLDIAVETYQRYESGESDIPLGVLFKIANVFHVELSALLTGEDPKLHVYSVVRKGKGMPVERRKDYEHQSLAFNFVQKKAEPFLVTVAPETDETPIAHNAHPGQEFNYVLQGTLKVCINNHEVILHEGDALYFDSSCEHGMKAIGDEPAQFLAIIL